MENFKGLIGVVLILGLAFLLSNNKKKINYRTVIVGLLIQLVLAFFILKVPFGKIMFERLGHWISRLLDFSNKGAEFVFGVFMDKDSMAHVFGPGRSFIFFFNIIPTIIFVCVLVNIGYHIGLLQKIIYVMAKTFHKLMRVSGSEALSNAASVFVGQVEAQIVIKPYLLNMTRSELFASMTGSMACIAGGIMAVYIQLGIPAAYLIAASVMAAPGALVIAKIMYPETEKSKTQGEVTISKEKKHANAISAMADGASEGLKIGLNVIAMLVAFIAIIALVDFLLGRIGLLFHHSEWSMSFFLSYIFSGFAWCMGIPTKDVFVAGSLMGKKFVINEFVAYLDLIKIRDVISAKTNLIVSFALCGFANLGSIAIQIGGIGELAPSRKGDLAKLGFKALVAGTLASYLSATLAGIIAG